MAQHIASGPPVASLFAAFLGYNPMKQLIPAGVLNALPAHGATLTGTQFFPSLISAPFKQGLAIAFTLSMVAYIVAAVASWLRGDRHVHEEQSSIVPVTQS